MSVPPRCTTIHNMFGIRPGINPEFDRQCEQQEDEIWWNVLSQMVDKKEKTDELHGSSNEHSSD